MSCARANKPLNLCITPTTEQDYPKTELNIAPISQRANPLRSSSNCRHSGGLRFQTPIQLEAFLFLDASNQRGVVSSLTLASQLMQ